MIYKATADEKNKTAEERTVAQASTPEEEMIERGYELLDSNPAKEVFDEVIFVFEKMYGSHAGWDLLAEALADILTERVLKYTGSTFEERKKSVQMLDRAIWLSSRSLPASDRIRRKMIGEINYGLWNEYRNLGDSCLLQNRYEAALEWYERSVDRTDIFRSCLKNIGITEESFRKCIHTAGKDFLESKLAGKIPFADVGTCSSAALAQMRKLFAVCYPMFPCFAIAGKCGGRCPYYILVWQDERNGVIQTYIEDNLHHIPRFGSEKDLRDMIRCAYLIFGLADMMDLREKFENNLQEPMA